MPGRIAASRLFALATLALIVLLAATPVALGLDRETVLARGQVWVDKRVPYSQRGWADAKGDIVPSATMGWRRDCSGMASYCLDLRHANGQPLSHDSSTITKVLVPITRDELRPGDIINRSRTYPGAAYGHAIVFARWSDESKTRYWAYDASGGAGGAVFREVPYPFWDPVGFFPYRYQRIQDYYPEWLEPIRGATRYETAVAASRRAFETGTVDTVVVCSGAGWADALGAAALAGAVRGPVLLVKPDELPSVVASEVVRSGASSAIVIGGRRAVGEGVERALASMLATVTRIGGADRYATASMVASAAVRESQARGGAPDGTVYVASGVKFPDALAASPAAASLVRPILLSKPGTMPAQVRSTIASLAPSRVVVLGGTGSISSEVESMVAQVVPVVDRIAGADRYETADLVARHCVDEGMSWQGLGFATGSTFPDALAGGVMQGALGAPLLLTPATYLHSAPASTVATFAPQIVQGRCFGGFGAVSSTVRGQIARLLGMGS